MPLLREEKLLEVELARTRQAIDKGKKNGKAGKDVINKSEWLLKKVEESVKKCQQIENDIKKLQLDLRETKDSEEQNRILLDIQNKKSELKGLKAAAKKQLQVIRLSSSGNSKAWDAVCNASSHIVAKAKDPVAVGLGLLAASVAISYAATPYLMLALGMSNPIGLLGIAVACLACMAICAVWNIFSAAKNAPASNRKAAQEDLDRLTEDMNKGQNASQGAGNTASMAPAAQTRQKPSVQASGDAARRAAGRGGQEIELQTFGSPRQQGGSSPGVKQ